MVDPLVLCALCLYSVLAGPALVPSLPAYPARSLTFRACGDANGDGIGDLAIGLPRDGAHGKNAGRVFVLSGEDASVIRELHAGGAHAGFGFALATGGDFDGDGKRDLVVAAHRDASGFTLPVRLGAPSARIHVFTLETGQLRRTIEMADESVRGRWASAIHPVGDVDGDGACDLLVERRVEADVRGGYCSPTTITSCKRGESLLRICFGSAVQPPIPLGSLGSSGQQALAWISDGRVRFSASPSLEPWDLHSDCLDGLRVRTLVDLGDMDRDGLAETAALGLRGENALCEDVRVLSLGQAFQPWCEVRGDRLRSAAGIEAAAAGHALEVCSLPDLDGDRRQEVLVLLPGASRDMRREEWSSLHPGYEMPLGMEVRGFAAAVSSRTGWWLWSAVGSLQEPLGMTTLEEGFGAEVGRVPDLDHDGLDDVGIAACCTTSADPYERSGVRLSVLSARSGRLHMAIEFNSGRDPQASTMVATIPPATRK